MLYILEAASRGRESTLKRGRAAVRGTEELC